MNREIKFRAWIGNRFIFSDDLRPDFAEVKQYKDDGLKMLVKRPKLSSDCVHSGNNISNHGEYNAEWCELQQYTGRQDKKGNDLYEGDIVNMISAKSGDKNKSVNKCLIKWDSTGMPGFTIVVLVKGEQWVYGYADYTSMERIGNIHENPELLK